MADQYVRVSPGRYRDTKTGKIINSATNPNKKAAAAPNQPSTPAAPGGNTGGAAAPAALPPVSNQGLIDLASAAYGSQLKGAAATTPFAYEAKDPTVKASLQGVQDLTGQAFDYLNKGITEREAQDREATLQMLANRGININNPQDPTYQRFMRDLEGKYQREREGAQNQAFTQGLQGTQALGNLELGQMDNAFKTALGTNSQQLTQLGQLGGAYQGAQQVRQNAQQIQINRQAANRPRGGAPAATEENPVFQNTPPPNF